MNIKLKLNPNPPMCTFNNLGVSIGIIDANIEDYTPWLLENFAGLHYRKAWKSITFNMPYSHRWRCFNSKLSVVLPYAQKLFLHRVCQDLFNQFYVYLSVNEKYLPERGAYQKADIIHDLYIFGFNDETCMFDTLGYNDKQLFKEQKIPFSTVFLAFSKKPENFAYFSFQLKKDYPFTACRPEKLRKEIDRYLKPKSSRYGIHAYEYVKRSLDSPKTVKVGNFRVLMEHMYVLMNLNRYGIDYKENYQKSKIAFTLVLKYSLTKEEHVLKRLNELLIQMEEGERLALSKYI